MSKDVLQKCKEFRNTMKLFFSEANNEMRLNTDLDFSKEEDLVYLGYNLFYGGSPINNGGPIMSKRDGDKYIQFSTNDYLGLSQNGDIHQYALEFLQDHHIGSPMGSRLLSGSTELHRSFEERIASFKKTEDALTFTTGSNAMMGAVSVLAGRGDIIIIDQYAHSSLNWGARVSGAEVKRFMHNDLNELEDILRQSDNNRAVLIVIDGVYSMAGDMAPLKEICNLKDKYGARLFVDDAHGNGVFGTRGSGIAEVEGVEERIDIHAGTFSKAFGSSGGFIATDRSIIEYLKFWAPTMLFTKAQPALITAVTMKALEYVIQASAMRDQIHENARYLQTKLTEYGFDIGSTTTPITPLTFSGNTAIYLSHELRQKYGIWVSPVIYPAISLGKSIIRIIPTALHTKEQLTYLCDSLFEAHQKLLQKPIFSEQYDLKKNGVHV